MSARPILGPRYLLGAVRTLRFFSTATHAFDVAVIGGGPGGYVSAIKAAQLGLKTAVIEKRPTIGGTCLNIGCIPSKCLLHSSHEYAALKARPPPPHGLQLSGSSLKKIGVKVDPASTVADLGGMHRHRARTVQMLTKGVKGLMDKNGVTQFEGLGRFSSPTMIEVDMANGRKEVVQAKHYVIATGSDSSSLPFMKVDGEVIVTSTEALEFAEVPKSMAVVGGGVIGLELGSVWARLGSKVTVIEYAPHILPAADIDVSQALQKSLQRHEKMEFHVGTGVTSAEVKDGRATLTLKGADGADKGTIDVEKVLVAVGRKPYTEGLGLDRAGVEMDSRSGMIKVNDGLQTNVPNIWAIGDVVRGPMLAHKAEDEGFAVAEKIYAALKKSEDPSHINYDSIPSVVYTHPEVAWVGKTEQDCKKAGIEYKLGVFPFSASGRAKCVDSTEGFVKVIARKDNDKLLGACIFQADAGELIHPFVLAINYGASSEDVARTCFAHPTLSEASREASMITAFGKAIHV
ncbi:hypothetical protein FOL47_001989 [Perkinsus chesapeaki]|uniref:Dihydrolipoyl dehydrogenase n=1 Tax=Perkinsus chesapeaki TaxID=330153 RepID=A0A7J6MFV4_PERCH|nr:hypothetical protein FOL47_001989 [Perkinsus chesapeaki]